MHAENASLVHAEDDSLVHAQVGRLGSLHHNDCTGTHVQGSSVSHEGRSKHADLQGVRSSKVFGTISDKKRLEDISAPREFPCHTSFDSIVVTCDERVWKRSALLP